MSFAKDSQGQYELMSPILISCGCGKVNSHLNNLRQVGMRPIPKVTRSNKMYTSWRDRNKLQNRIPPIRERQHLVLYHHKTGRWLDVLKLPAEPGSIPIINRVFQGE